jgi:hypothetical protein
MPKELRKKDSWSKLYRWIEEHQGDYEVNINKIAYDCDMTRQEVRRRMAMIADMEPDKIRKEVFYKNSCRWYICGKTK